MSEPSAEVVASIEALLTDWNGEIHDGWRCEYPDRFGPCGCVAEAARDIARVAEAAALRAAAVRVHSLVAVADRQGDLDHPPGLMLARAALDMTAYDLEASDD